MVPGRAPFANRESHSAVRRGRMAPKRTSSTTELSAIALGAEHLPLSTSTLEHSARSTRHGALGTEHSPLSTEH